MAKKGEAMSCPLIPDNRPSCFYCGADRLWRLGHIADGSSKYRCCVCGKFQSRDTAGLKERRAKQRRQIVEQRKAIQRRRDAKTLAEFSGDPSGKKFIRANDAAAHYGLTRQRIHQMIQSGQLQSRKVGGFNWVII